MIRALSIVVARGLALAFADARLAQRAAEERASRARVGRPVSEAERESWQLTCIEVQDGSGSGALYLRYAGMWRCRTHNGAPADGQALEGLYASLALTDGVVHAESPRDPREYGFGDAGTWRVTLHGPGAAEPLTRTRS